MGRVLAAVAAVAVILLGRTPAWAQPVRDLQDFRMLVAEKVRARYPGAKVVLLARDGLSVTIPGAEPRDQVLTRAYALYADDPKGRDEIVGNLVEAFAPIPIEASRLIVLVRSLNAFPAGQPPEGRLVRPLVGKLVAIVAIDGPAAYDFTEAEVLRRRLGLDNSAIWTRAVANTRDQTQVQPGQLPDGQIVRLSTGRGLASSLLADDEFWNLPILVRAGPIVVAALTRDEIFFTPQKNTAQVASLRKMMAEAAGDPNNLAEGLMVRREGRWEILP